MSDTTFETLFKGYMNGTLDAEGIRRFRAMALQREYQQQLSQLLEAAFSDPAYIERGDVDAAEMAREITAKIRQQDAAIEELRAPRKPLLLRFWAPYAAAALLFLLVAIGTLLWLPMKRRAVRTAEPPALAMITRPTLTLGDGSSIALDSLANGTIAQQNHTSIVKQGNGQLAYQASGSDSGLLFNTLQTPPGTTWQITLPDGSRVWLNASSAIRYPAAFTGKNRSVGLTGEAFFDIVKDDNKPFIVNAKNVQTQVLGTAFNVMAYPDEESVNTTLVQGSVKVNSRLLQAGEQAQVNKEGGLLITRPSLEEILGWKNGEFYFRNTNIRNIMREVARWYDVDVKYEGDMSEITMSGIVSRTAEITQLLKALEMTKIVRFRINGRTITVLPYKAG
ncbi:FecR family protein [Chitinophaga vietnamensis]|uniref:FecR family protein n=1 Tax=Chitinophaga vietnamensis TaxID=2593957 RepID=UPI001177B221|nr:FecR family protein [Chitinophaga vietnamensis]